MSTSVPRPWTPPDRCVLILVSVIVILLNVFDALATVELIDRGGEEANPIAQAVLRSGTTVFLSWKIGLAGICTIGLACLSRKRRIAWWAFVIAVTVYAAVALLHIYLLWCIDPSALAGGFFNPRRRP